MFSFEEILQMHNHRKVDAHYTSQRCPKCGCIDRANRDKSQHLFKCIQCGYQ